MRYKFRAWDVENKKMITSPLVLHANGNIEYPQGGWDVAGFDESNSYKVMMFTGLKDRNGIEIYEGDVVFTTYTDHQPKIGEIYFQPTRLNWSVKHSNFANQDLFVYARPDCIVEVIGNLWENPELLEPKGG